MSRYARSDVSDGPMLEPRAGDGKRAENCPGGPNSNGVLSASPRTNEEAGRPVARRQPEEEMRMNTVLSRYREEMAWPAARQRRMVDGLRLLVDPVTTAS